jgi:hypothetical protein
VNAPQYRQRSTDRYAKIALLGDHVVGIQVNSEVGVSSQADEVYGLGGGVDQMSSEPAHRFNYHPHTQAAGVIRQRMEVLRRCGN